MFKSVHHLKLKGIHGNCSGFANTILHLAALSETLICFHSLFHNLLTPLGGNHLPLYLFSDLLGVVGCSHCTFPWHLCQLSTNEPVYTASKTFPSCKLMTMAVLNLSITWPSPWTSILALILILFWILPCQSMIPCSWFLCLALELQTCLGNLFCTCIPSWTLLLSLHLYTVLCVILHSYLCYSGFSPRPAYWLSATVPDICLLFNTFLSCLLPCSPSLNNF